MAGIGAAGRNAAVAVVTLSGKGIANCHPGASSADFFVKIRRSSQSTPSIMSLPIKSNFVALPPIALPDAGEALDEGHHPAMVKGLNLINDRDFPLQPLTRDARGRYLCIGNRRCIGIGGCRGRRSNAILGGPFPKCGNFETAARLKIEDVALRILEDETAG
jgi:hypothetical protein